MLLLEHVKRRSIARQIFFLLFVIEPQVKNDTEKILPFKLWIDFPYHSPYYEITYTIQVIL